MKNTLLLAVTGLMIFAGCTQNKPVKTISDLKDGIKGESTASAKYAAFAQKAKEEGHNSVAKLFEAASKSESIHASNHKKALESLGEKIDDFKPEFEVKTTAEILQSAIDGETYEVNVMYPMFLKDAQLEKADKAEKSFTWAIDTEKKHKKFYADALKALKEKADKKLTAEYVVCPVCGNTYEKGSADEKCAFCQTSKEKFISI